MHVDPKLFAFKAALCELIDADNIKKRRQYFHENPDNPVNEKFDPDKWEKFQKQIDIYKKEITEKNINHVWADLDPLSDKQLQKIRDREMMIEEKEARKIFANSETYLTIDDDIKKLRNEIRFFDKRMEFVLVEGIYDNITRTMDRYNAKFNPQ